MSRTDKDKPWWVRTNWYVAAHEKCPFDSYRRDAYWSRSRECDLPPDPLRSNFAQGYQPRWIRRPAACTWEPEWPRRDRYNFTRPPSREDKHLGWWGPDRRDVRDLMIEARKQYHGNREVEILEPVQHHRHTSKKGWWD